MATALSAGEEQKLLWNSTGARAWIDLQELLDRVLLPFEGLLVDAAGAASATRVLDVGCGTGSTTLGIARRIGGGGRCVGIDISEPMIALARKRAEAEGAPAEFIAADAQTHVFDPASFDMIVSRFGVMFFEDPVEAFANLRHAARPGAGLFLIAWRGPEENPFMTTAERAAAPLLPDAPPRRPDGPGQFAFADRERVQHVLEQSGWSAVDIRPADVTCAFPESDLVRYFTRLGPIGLALSEAEERTHARIVDTVRPAFEPFVHGSEVRFTAACWVVQARAEDRTQTTPITDHRHKGTGSA